MGPYSLVAGLELAGIVSRVDIWISFTSQTLVQARCFPPASPTIWSQSRTEQREQLTTQKQKSGLGET